MGSSHVSLKEIYVSTDRKSWLPVLVGVAVGAVIGFCIVTWFLIDIWLPTIRRSCASLSRGS